MMILYNNVYRGNVFMMLKGVCEINMIVGLFCVGG